MWFFMDMHVESQWVNKLLFPPLIKDKRGEPPMTPRLAALVKQVAELCENGLKVCHCTEEVTLQRIRPLGHREKLAFECPRLANSNRDLADGKIFILHVLPATICYFNLIYSFFYSALTKTEIDRLVGYFFGKDPPVLWPNSVLVPYCAENHSHLLRTITFFILHLIYD
jgi:hypothetical protein